MEPMVRVTSALCSIQCYDTVNALSAFTLLAWCQEPVKIE